jgi:multiple sugar transport system ATP-binding protein
VDVEPTGAETYLVIDVAGIEVTAVAKERLSVQPGDQVRVMLESQRSHLFDAESSLRL